MKSEVQYVVAEDHMLSKDEAYMQLGQSASLLKAILEYAQ